MLGFLLSVGVTKNLNSGQSLYDKYMFRRRHVSVFFPAVICTIYKQYVLELPFNNCKQTCVFVLTYQSCHVLPALGVFLGALGRLSAGGHTERPPGDYWIHLRCGSPPEIFIPTFL